MSFGREPRGGTYLPSPVAYEGAVYVADRDGNLEPL